MDTDLDIRLLGGLAAHRGGRALELGGPRQRRVLAFLALTPGRVVPAARLIDLVWDGEAPPSARSTLQSYVSNLRRTLGPGSDGRPTIACRNGGYALDVPAGTLDVERVEAVLRRGDARRWEPLLPELGDHPCLLGERRRLTTLQAAALATTLEARVARGEHRAVLADLQAAVAEHPTDERLWGAFTLALYRCGRQADALRALHEARAGLADHGLEPGAALRGLEAQVLAQDPGLDLDAETADRPARITRPGAADRAARGRLGCRRRRPAPCTARVSPAGGGLA